MESLSQVSIDEAMRVAVAVALTAWVAWWAIALLVAVVDRRAAARIAPPLLRALLIGGVVAATATPAHADGAACLDGLRLPERPVTTVVAPAPPADVRPEAVTVQPGDSLWSIARAARPHADDARIAAEVRRWHQANREVIGADPNLIHPGQRLIPPGVS